MTHIDDITTLKRRLDYMVHRGPGIGLPDTQDHSSDADLRRRVFALAGMALSIEASGHTTERDCWRSLRFRADQDVGRLLVLLEASDLPWPYKSDLWGLLHAAHAIFVCPERSAA